MELRSSVGLDVELRTRRTNQLNLRNLKISWLKLAACRQLTDTVGCVRNV